MPQIEASLLVPSTCTGVAPGQPEQQGRDLDQPAAADHGVDEPGRQPGERQQREHGQRRVLHAEIVWSVRVRIVSLLPSTTEILFAIGAGDDVVGVTFECDFPAEARTRTIVSTSAMPRACAPPEIDAYVADRDGARRGPLPPRRRAPSPAWTPTSS